MAADLTHLPGRIPDGHGHPGEDDRRHAADVADQRLQLAARVLADCLARGDEGAAKRHVQALRLDADPIDPWQLALVATARAMRHAQGG